MERRIARALYPGGKAAADHLADDPAEGRAAALVPPRDRSLPAADRPAGRRGRESRRRSGLCPYRRLRDRRGGAGDERRGRLVEESERQGQLARRARQRGHRARSPDAHAAGCGRRAAGTAGQQAPGCQPGERDHARRASRLCGDLVQPGCRRARYLRARGAQAREARAEAVTAELHRLANGMTVAVDSVPAAESVAVGLYARVGSRSEPERLGGLAHLVEHMVFKGAGGRDTRALAEAIENVGGSLNAWTARDQTVFHGRALSRDLTLLTELIADLVRAPHLDEEHLEREKQVILSELGESVDSPDDLVHDHLFEAAFEEQAIGRPVLGTETSVRSATRQDCRDWLEQQFAPARLVLSASGKVRPDEIVRLAEALYGDISAGEAPSVDAAQFTGGVR